MSEGDLVELLQQESARLYRDMPWRQTTSGYFVLVSELMLQQTQVSRVIPKFEAFIEKFPDFHSLAAAPLSEVLILWNGLGYNRRAKYLHQAAQKVVSEHDGQLPADVASLCALPGVGVNTAGALMAYVHNQPVMFVETNVRTVYIHHFFEGRTEVTDAMILEKLKATLDTKHPREFYWGLMDYGSWLKSQGVRVNARQKNYRTQSPLKGSHREMRGWIVRDLTKGGCSLNDLRTRYDGDVRFDSAYEQLLQEEMVVERGDQVSLTNS